MKKIIVASFLIVLNYSFSQEGVNQNSINSLIEEGLEAMSFIYKSDINLNIPNNNYEVGVLYIRNSSMGKAPSKRVNEKGMVYYYFLSSSDGDKRFNNIPNAIKKWSLLQTGEGNEMKLIADKLNEGWEIINMDQTYTSVSVSGTSLGPAANGWIIHFKRKLK